MIDADVLENPSLEPNITVCCIRSNLGKSVFVRRFVHHIRHMMTPIPHRTWWCYGEYQILYRTLDGVDFQHGWPDLDKYIYLCIVIPILSTKNERTSHKFPGLWCIVVVSTVLSKASIFTFPPRCT